MKFLKGNLQSSLISSIKVKIWEIFLSTSSFKTEFVKIKIYFIFISYFSCTNIKILKNKNLFSLILGAFFMKQSILLMGRVIFSNFLLIFIMQPKRLWSRHYGTYDTLRTNFLPIIYTQPLVPTIKNLKQGTKLLFWPIF